MSDGVLDGMQHFDSELSGWSGKGRSRRRTVYLYATNAGDLRVTLSDMPTEQDA